MKKSIALILFLAVLVFTLSVFPVGIQSFASEVTAPDFIVTDVLLQNTDGSSFGNDVAKDADVRLTFAFTIDNANTIQTGDTYTFVLPNEILVSAPKGFQIADGSDTLIASGSVATDGTTVLTFTDYPSRFSNISGYFWFDLQFNAAEIGSTNPEEISFSFPGIAEPINEYINFDQTVTSVSKSAAYDDVSKTITWTIIANQEAVDVYGAQLVDTIASGLTFVPSSLTLNGSALNEGDYTFLGDQLSYSFPAHIDTQQTIVFDTVVAESEFKTENAHGTILQKQNTAVLNHNGGSTDSGAVTINIPISYISKMGVYNGDSTNPRISWTITINENNLSLTNVTLIDTLPPELAVVTGSVMVDGASTGSDQLTYAFGDISESHVMTYTTDINDPDAFAFNGSTTYTNSAVLTGDDVPSNAAESDDVVVGSSIIRKIGVSYNPATAEILWRIYVNENQITINNAVITDIIEADQEYVTGSATLDGVENDPNFNYEAASKTLTYTFINPVTEEHQIELRTKIVDPDVYTNNVTQRFYNTAGISGDNITSSQSTGNRNIRSEVIDKSSTDYNYETQEITWNIQVNENETPLSDVVITDTIAVGMQYVEGSAAIDNGASGAFNYTPANAGDTQKSGTLTYTFSGAIAQTYNITFKTVVTDTDVYKSNGTKSFSNTARVTHSTLSEEASDTSTRTFENTFIGKTAEYTTENTYIDWTVDINTSDINFPVDDNPLAGAVITDVLQQGLTLDTASVRLFEQDINPDGTMTVGDEVIPLTSDNVAYAYDTRTFEFTMPDTANGSYLLTFRTNVTDKTRSPFSNTVTFDGTGTIENSEPEQVGVSWTGSGSSAVGEVGSMNIIKVDSEDNATLLQGGVFELIDRYGNVVNRQTTDADGEALFEWLRFDIPYTVQEITAPEGYNLNATPYTFQIDGSAEAEKHLTYTYENTVIKGGIEFTKYGVNASPLQGAQYTLYDANDVVTAVAVSQSDGLVSLQQIPYGSYTIRETSPPEGYLLSATELTASIVDEGVTVATTPASVTNQIIIGSIELMKTEDDGVTPLANAQLSLYRAADTSYLNPIDEIVSGADGSILFDDIEYGDYVIRETIAPPSYVRSNEVIRVSVTEDNVTVDAGAFKNRREEVYFEGSIEVIVVDAGGKPIPGAKIGVFYEGTIKIVEAISDVDGKVLFEQIPNGSYTIKQLAVPDGFELNTEIILVEITSTGLYQYTYVNTKGVQYFANGIPRTGDQILYYAAVLLLSLIIIFGIFAIDKHIKIKFSKNNKREL